MVKTKTKLISALKQLLRTLLTSPFYIIFMGIQHSKLYKLKKLKLKNILGNYIYKR